jgi:hypothetical protein
MTVEERALYVFRELADQYERRGDSQMRDRFLVLAADAAHNAGHDEEAERMRQRLLKSSPHHLLKPYSSFAEALQAEDVQIYVNDLRANYPPDVADNLLKSLRQRAGGAHPIPPTAPVIDLNNPKPDPLRQGPVPLRFYGLQEEKPGQTPLPPEIPLRRPPPSPQTASPTAPRKSSPPSTRPTARPVSSARPAAPAAKPVPSASEPVRPETEMERGGSWLGAMLFGVTLVAGLGLAAYTLARPFLPPGWLP